jgi:O-antigen ligase
VNLGGLGGAAVALAVVAWARPRIGPWLAAVAASAALVQLAGGRIALLVVIGVLAWALVRRGVKVALLATVAVVLGLAVAAPISTASGTGSTERLDSAARSEGVASRLENWYSARHAVADHPLLGSGPGTYLAATEKYRTPKLGRLDGGDSVYADAHNLAVEYVVTMGVVGLVALIAFALLAGRRAGGAMLAVALALLVAHAVQPQNVGLTPLLFLVLGAAGPRSPGHEVAVRTWPLRLVLVPLALGATGVLLFADHELRQSDLDFTESQARAAERLLPRWKEPAALLSRNFLYLGIVKDDQAEQYFEQSEQWRREAVRREPYDASMWFRLGDLQLRRLEVAEAETSFRRALAANPTSASARVGLGHTFLLKKEDATALEWLEDALTFIPNPEARADVEKLITDARAR